MRSRGKRNNFPLRGYLFLVCAAFFTALSYIFGKFVNNEYDPETTVFFWFLSAFFVSIIVVILVPSQRTELRSFGKYIPIFFYRLLLCNLN